MQRLAATTTTMPLAPTLWAALAQTMVVRTLALHLSVEVVVATQVHTTGMVQEATGRVGMTSVGVVVAAVGGTTQHVAPHPPREATVTPHLVGRGGRPAGSIGRPPHMKGVEAGVEQVVAALLTSRPTATFLQTLTPQVREPIRCCGCKQHMVISLAFNS
jgi:hypothetical protein